MLDVLTKNRNFYGGSPNISLSGRLPHRRRLAHHVNEVHIVCATGGLIRNDGDTATTDVMRITHGEITLEHPGQMPSMR